MMLEKAFKGGKRLKYSDVLTELSLVFQQHAMNMGRNKLVEFQKFYANKGWIKTEKDGQNKYPVWVFAS
jgi:hypothetical protein